MARQPLWEHRLADLLARAQTRAFAYGAHDCCLWACDAIAELTGDDPGAPYRGTYASKREAGAVLKPYGGIKGIAEAIAKARGFAPVSPVFAQRGDVVLAKIRGGHTLGVCIGARAAFASQPEGLAYFPMTSPVIVGAWRIT